MTKTRLFDMSEQNEDIIFYEGGDGIYIQGNEGFEEIAIRTEAMAKKFIETFREEAKKMGWEV